MHGRQQLARLLPTGRHRKIKHTVSNSCARIAKLVRRYDRELERLSVHYAGSLRKSAEESLVQQLTTDSLQHRRRMQHAADTATQYFGAFRLDGPE